MTSWHTLVNFKLQSTAKGMVIKMKIIKISVCVLFFALCSFFSLGTLINGSSIITEGGIEKPQLFTNDGINRNFGNEYEEYFSRAFAYRRYVVDAWSDIRINLFSDGNDQVIVGKNQYLFFSDTTDSYTGLDRMTDEEINLAADALLDMQNYAESRGVKFCFMPAPNKNTIYPENMPKRYIKAEVSDLDRLFSALDEREVTYVDVREELLNSKESEQIYYLTDTHWTPDGAYKAFGLLSDKLGFEKVNTSNLSRINEDIEGDLNTLLYPGRTIFETVEVCDFSESYIYTSAFSTPMDMVITTRSGGKGNALIFRDSFCNSMIGCTASTFENVQFERANPYRIDLIDSMDLDYCIIEIAERNIRDLIGSNERIKDVID